MSCRADNTESSSTCGLFAPTVDNEAWACLVKAGAGEGDELAGRNDGKVVEEDSWLCRLTIREEEAEEEAEEEVEEEAGGTKSRL